MTAKRWLIIGLVLMLILGIVGLVIAQQPGMLLSSEEQPMMAGMMPPGNNPMMMGDPPMMGDAPMMGGGDPLMMWQKIAKELELTPEQKKSMETIFLEGKKKTIQLKAEREIQQIDLMQSLREPNANEAKVKETVKTIGKLQAEMLETHIDGILKAKKILTPAQQEKAMTMIMEMKHRGMMEPGMMRPGMMGQGMMRREMMQPGMMGQGMMRQEMMKKMRPGDKSGEEKEEEESEEKE